MIQPDEQDQVACSVSDAGSLGNLLRFSHTAMATLFEIFCVHGDKNYARQAAGAAFDEVDRLEAELSRFVENSDISRINHLAAGQSVRVAACTMDCLQIARRIYAETGGSFDVALGSGFVSLELEPADFIVRVHADGIRLDLGGIGKGYAVDCMSAVLRDWEIDRSLIHAGHSSVLALKPPPGGQGWPLTLSTPGTGTVLARITARKQAIGGSGIRKGDHILEPRERRPIRQRSAAWVSVLRNIREEWPAAVADALSTAFMILSAQEIEQFCEKRPGVEAWVLEGCPEQQETIPLIRHFP